MHMFYADLIRLDLSAGAFSCETSQYIDTLWRCWQLQFLSRLLLFQHQSVYNPFQNWWFHWNKDSLAIPPNISMPLNKKCILHMCCLIHSGVARAGYTNHGGQKQS
ncbi:hypothetical protein FKM82_009860 [Ascaphus truei]